MRSRRAKDLFFAGHPPAASRQPHPPVGHVEGVLRLQRSAGNAAVTALIQRQPAGAQPLELYELTLPEFVGVSRLQTAKLNNPSLKRTSDSSGPPVYAVQKALIRAGFPMPGSTKKNKVPPEQESPNDPGFADRTLDPDGIWGDETTATIQKFQRKKDLEPDARVGNKTLKALQEAAAGPTPIVPTPARTAGVESFTVRYSKDDLQDGKIRIDADAVFTQDATHDPTVAEFQQFVSSQGRTSASQFVFGNKDVHDDNYHRDPARIDQRSQTYSGNTYHMTDRAGISPLAKDEELDFRFTAEQRIVDLSRRGMVIARRGPHTVVVKGREPRRYEGAPRDL